MLIPSTGLIEILHGSQVGVWPELLMDESLALVVKLPQTIIKRIYRGVECRLVTAMIEVAEYDILYIGFVVYDDAKSPFVVVQPVATEKALTEFQHMFRASPIKLHMFDEFCHPLLESSCNFDPMITAKAFKNIMSIDPHVLGATSSDTDGALAFGHAVVTGLDIFQKDLESIKRGGSSISVPGTNWVISLSLILHHYSKGYSVDAMGNTVEYTLTQEDEGYAFEQLLSFTMRGLYHGRAYLRPITMVGGKERELADFLALNYTDNTILLVQAKATGSLQLRLDQSSEKRTSSTQKKVKSGLRQLVGAIKQIRAGNETYDSDHNTIQIPEPSISPIHGIVVVSELYAFVDWKKVGRDLSSINNNEEYKTLFQVIDLQELQQLVKNSNSIEDFHKYLLGRWLKVKMSGTAYVRSRTRQPWDSEK